MYSEAVVVQNVSFSYAGSTDFILKDINLTIRSGEFVTITGSSGCGKSTLALALAGFIPHSVAGNLTGNIHIKGMNTRNYSPARLAGGVGLVQQDPEAGLCTLKVRDEVAFGPENLCLSSEDIQERIYWALDAVNCRHLINREVHSLSGGEKQRIAIAAILAMQPSVLILDEPTANLDPIGMREVLQVIEKLRREKNMTIIIIEHRLKQLLPLTDRLIVMEKGQIVIDNTPEKINFSANYPTYTNRIKNLIKENETINPLLQVDNLSFGYGQEVILNNISFKLSAGEVVAIMGDNGSGKTSLLMSILGINKISAGKVFIKGNDITNKKVAYRAKELGLVFQNPNHQIFEHTVFKEAHLPSRLLCPQEASRSNTEEFLKNFELFEYRDDLPFILSLGEKKRLTLVSVLAYHPSILILDEPLVGQDEYRISLFWEKVALHAERGGGTLMVCHEPNFVEAFCDRIIFLKDGNILVNEEIQKAFAMLAEYGLHDYIPNI